MSSKSNGCIPRGMETYGKSLSSFSPRLLFWCSCNWLSLYRTKTATATLLSRRGYHPGRRLRHKSLSPFLPPTSAMKLSARLSVGFVFDGDVYRAGATDQSTSATGKRLTIYDSSNSWWLCSAWCFKVLQVWFPAVSSIYFSLRIQPLNPVDLR